MTIFAGIDLGLLASDPDLLEAEDLADIREKLANHYAYMGKFSQQNILKDAIIKHLNNYTALTQSVISENLSTRDLLSSYMPDQRYGSYACVSRESIILGYMERVLSPYNKLSIEQQIKFIDYCNNPQESRAKIINALRKQNLRVAYALCERSVQILKQASVTDSKEYKTYLICVHIICCIDMLQHLNNSLKLYPLHNIRNKVMQDFKAALSELNEIYALKTRSSALFFNWDYVPSVAKSFEKAKELYCLYKI